MEQREAFVRRLVEDLYAASALLLDAGSSPKARQAYGARRHKGLLGPLLADISDLARLVPAALSELQHEPGIRREVWSLSSRAQGARRHLRAQDLVLHEGELRARRFEQLQLSGALEGLGPRWLLGLCGRLEQQLERQTGRLAKHLGEELSQREDRTWALRLENEALRQLQARLERGQGQLQRAAALLHRQAGGRLRPSQRPPDPFPRGPAHQRLRRIAAGLDHPTARLHDNLGRLRQDASELADLPYLYQRWCGLQIAEGLGQLGWQAIDATLPRLLVGGCVTWRRGSGEMMELWCEPHLTRRGRHACGLYSQQQEASPDYLFLLPGVRGPEAFVLDPTLRCDEAGQREKARYLQDLAFDRPRPVAGIPSLHLPQRSWAVAPLLQERCSLFDLAGRSGVIPLHPLQEGRAALLAWLSDLDALAVG